VRSALLTARFEFPARRITVNLAPADLPKEGGRFDLPIALGILAASGQIPADSLSGHEFIGELALTGELRPVRGALTAALQARARNRALVVPRANADEAALAEASHVLAAGHLLDVSGYLARTAPPRQPRAGNPARRCTTRTCAKCAASTRPSAALEIAAAGGHSLLLIGPPGTGKTMLASRLPGILPPMTDTEALEAAAVQSSATRVSHWRAGSSARSAPRTTPPPRGAGRRRQHADAGRDLARPPWRAVPR